MAIGDYTGIAGSFSSSILLTPQHPKNTVNWKTLNVSTHTCRIRGVEYTACDRLAYTGGFRITERQPMDAPDRQIRESLGLQSVTVPTDGFDRF